MKKVDARLKTKIKKRSEMVIKGACKRDKGVDND